MRALQDEKNIACTDPYDRSGIGIALIRDDGVVVDLTAGSFWTPYASIRETPGSIAAFNPRDSSRRLRAAQLEPSVAPKALTRAGEWPTVGENQFCDALAPLDEEFAS